MIIIGAGMAGLLCGALNPGSIIYEAGEKKDNHQAVFRCKSDRIGQMLGIDFKKVMVHKSIWYLGKEMQPSPRMTHMYSQKVTGKITGRSIMNIDSGIRYLPPDNFLDILRDRCSIKYELTFPKRAFLEARDSIVSTIPMPAISNILNITGGGFESQPIYVNVFEIDDCDSYCTVYYPEACSSTYRASLTGNKLIIESMRPTGYDEQGMVFESLGIADDCENIVENKKQKFGKITPIDNTHREAIITNLTIDQNIYSLGRLATWRPKVMLDDVLKDIFHIRKLIQGGRYAALKHKQEEMS